MRNLEIEPDLKALTDMLEYRRPHGSKTERKFIGRFIRPLVDGQDNFGNLYKRIEGAPILWSCHTDSVHRTGGKQRIVLRNGHTIALHRMETESNCLGADDAAGCWLMTEMIKANVPGLYVFHRGEERGCLGSSHIAKNETDRLKGIEMAIAFDRRDTSSVITHQWSRCCSDEFASDLARRLGEGWAPDDTGLYTDTAEYTDLIGECTNLSVGYYNEHSTGETLFVPHLLKLRNAMVHMDLGNCAVVRRPGDYDDDAITTFNRSNWNSYSSYGASIRDSDRGTAKSKGDNWLAMVQLVRNHPSYVADMLHDWGYDATGLAIALEDRGALIADDDL